MKRMRIMGLCLVAVFAVSAFAASGASALPEIGKCVAKAGTGKYKDANCNEKAGTLKSEKSFEFLKEIGKAKFTSSGGAGVLETEAGTKVECTTQSATGEYDVDLSPTTGKQLPTKEVDHVTAKFNGCSLPLLGAKCNTAGSGEGEIVTKPLEGGLGYISGKGTKTPSVGQELEPMTVKGKFVEFECSSAAKVAVGEGGGKGGDCIIAPVANANEMSLTATQFYSGEKGKQTPQHFEGSAAICNLESNLNGGAFERATQALSTTVTNEEALEIKA
jgi:hypothetical protein